MAEQDPAPNPQKSSSTPQSSPSGTPGSVSRLPTSSRKPPNMQSENDHGSSQVSPHVNHDDLFVAELKHRLSGFQIGKTALESKIAGIKADYLKTVEEAAAKRDRALAPEEKSYKQILKSIRIAEAALDESETAE